jgi:hypothetical protein
MFEIIDAVSETSSLGVNPDIRFAPGEHLYGSLQGEDRRSLLKGKAMLAQEQPGAGLLGKRRAFRPEALEAVGDHER